MWLAKTRETIRKVTRMSEGIAGTGFWSGSVPGSGSGPGSGPGSGTGFWSLARARPRALDLGSEISYS